MFDEMSFLFNLNKQTKNVNTDVQNTVVKKEQDSNTGAFYDSRYTVTKGDVKNFIKSQVNKPYSASDRRNPYIKLVNDFSNPNPASLKLRYSDFAYLKNIGVFPINRLMILRRFREGTVVPNDLNNLRAEPISVIIGWVKEDKEILNFSLGENWVHQGSDKMLHKLLNDIMSNEFGMNLNQLVPIPGWGLNFIFGMLSTMKLTNPDLSRIPIGNPNLLKESITRDHENFGLKSTFNFTLETSYEQKYIGGIDPYVAMNDILYNIMTMATSDTVVIGNPNSELLGKLSAANERPTDSSGWKTLITDIVTGFVDQIKNGQIGQAITGLNKLKTDNTAQAGKKADKKTDSDTVSPKTALDAKANTFEKTFKDLVETVLASTIARYTWPLRGSIAMLTGEAVTPWHLTIGNPYSPILSMNNIYVKNIDVKMGSDLAFNDISKNIDITVSMEQGRNMGRNEIYKMFGVEYQRYYKQEQDKATTTSKNTITK
jgi:hypothetical protein